MATIPSDQKLVPVGGTTEDFGKVRFIGLELESTRNINSLPKIENLEWHIGSWRGLAQEEGQEFKKLIDPEERYIAMVGADGGDVELATQPMTPNEIHFGGFGAILNRYQRYCLPDEASGTHMHISKLRTDKKTLWRNLYWFSVVYDKQLYLLFRRKSSWAKSPKEALKDMGLTKISIDKIEELNYPNFGNKGTLIVNRKKTYECRGGSASTSPSEIKAWSLLFYNIVELCNQKTIVGHRFEEVLPKNLSNNILEERLTGEQKRQICPIDLYLN